MRTKDPKKLWNNFVKNFRRGLREAKDEPPEKGEDSVDNQIDRYLAAYESEAKSSIKEARDWRMTVRRLLEAEEGEEEPADDEGGEEEGEEEKPKKLPADSIDIESYVNSVMRLVENYDSLLELRDTILRRAVNFIGKNYESTAVNQFRDSLRDAYGFDIGKSVDDVQDEQHPAPPADRASGPGGGGA